MAARAYRLADAATKVGDRRICAAVRTARLELKDAVRRERAAPRPLWCCTLAAPLQSGRSPLSRHEGHRCAIQLQHSVILDTEAAIVAPLVAPRVKERKRASISVVVGQRAM
jgi:hypothetical protein